MTDHTLPIPPSANTLVRPLLMAKVDCPKCHLSFFPKKPKLRLVSTGAAKAFRKAVHELLEANPIDGPVEIFVTVYVDSIASDGRNRDKALDDALNGRLFFDDKQIAEWHGCKIIGDDVGIVVTVVPADPVKHAELARRLAKSKVGELAAARNQPELLLGNTTDGEITVNSHRLSKLPENLRDKLARLAKPASYPASTKAADEHLGPPDGWDGAA